MGNRPTLRALAEAGAAENRAAMAARQEAVISQSGNFEETQREIKTLIEQGLKGAEIINLVWGNMVGVQQGDSLAGLIDEIIGIKYDENGEVQSPETLTKLILDKRTAIEGILQPAQ